MRDNRGIKVTPDDDDDDDIVRAWPRLVVSPYARGFSRPDTISFSRLGNPLPPPQNLARVASARTLLPRSPLIRSVNFEGKIIIRRAFSFLPSENIESMEVHPTYIRRYDVKIVFYLCNNT